MSGHQMEGRRRKTRLKSSTTATTLSIEIPTLSSSLWNNSVVKSETTTASSLAPLPLSSRLLLKTSCSSTIGSLSPTTATISNDNNNKCTSTSSSQISLSSTTIRRRRKSFKCSCQWSRLSCLYNLNNNSPHPNPNPNPNCSSSHAAHAHHHYLINMAMLLLFCSVTWLTLTTTICYAQDSDFALRPFSASLLHSSSSPLSSSSSSSSSASNIRRQDVIIGGAGGINSGSVNYHEMPPTIDIVGLANNPAKRHSPNEPNLMPILTAPVPRGSGSNPRPSFQRIRLNSNIHNQALQQPPPQPIAGPSVPTIQNQPVPRQQQPAAQNIAFKPPPSSPFLLPEEYVPVALTESPLPNFQRLVGLSPPNGRQPQSPVLPTSSISISAPAQQAAPSLPVVAAPQRQSFRRIKPPSNGNWRVSPKPKSQQAAAPIVVLPQSPPAPIPIQIEPSRSATVRPAIAVPASNNARLVANSAALIDIQNNKLHGRGPISAQDEDLSHKPNALDNEDDPGIIDRDRSSYYGNRLSPTETVDDNGILAIESLSRNSQGFEPIRTRGGPSAQPQPTQVPSVVPTPTIPLTYYTTYTYYTTVVRGPHTAMLSREQVASSTQLKPIDRNIVTAIEFSNGYIQPQPTKTLLGTKTKGQTTTIYDVASRVQVFNDDLYKVIFATSSQILPPQPSSSMVAMSSSSNRITPTRTQSSTILLKSTPVMSRHQSSKPSMNQVKSSVTVRLEQLQNQLKKQLSLLTYYYTLIEGTRTQYSTRVEESSTNYNGDLATLVPSIAPTIDSYGLLKIISPHSVVSLGSRANGQQTTVVNLALNNYIKFNRVKDAQIEIVPTSVLSSSSSTSIVQPTATIHPTSSLSGSLQSEIGQDLQSSTTETPRLDSTPTPTPALSSTPISPISESSSVSRSRTPSSSRRPGVRIKVKPIRSKLVNHLSRHSSKPASITDIESSSSPLLASSSLESSLRLTPTIVDQTPVLTSMIEPSTPDSIRLEPSTTPRKKVAFTIRRPGSQASSGVNRFFSRRPSSHLLYAQSSSISSSTPTIELSSTSSSSDVSQLMAPSSTISPWPSSSIMETLSTVMVPSIYSSMVAMPTPSLNDFFSQLSSSSSSPSMSSSPSSSLLHHQQRQSASPVWNQQAQPSKTSKNRLVVLTRLAGAANAINKWNPMYNSRIRVSSRRLIKSTNPAMMSSMMIEPMPSSAYETLIIETTTHTVPFTIGSSITYTTVEETNSRTVTNLDWPMSSPTPEEMMSSSSELITPSISSAASSSSLTPSLASSYVIVETSDIITTSTLYSTYTYFATLFNGTQTSITPLEEIKTEYLTLREPVRITRTIVPSVQFTPSSSIVATRTIDGLASTTDSVESLDNDDMTKMITETYSTQTTLTHFITLFSGTHTILSSIEEISPTVMTRTRFITPYTLITTSHSSSSSHDSYQHSTGTISTITPSSSSSQMADSATSDLASTTTTIQPSLFDISSSVTTPGSISLDADQIYMIDQSPALVDEQQPALLQPNGTLSATTTTTTSLLEPGSVIELDDLLDGVHDAGPIGETIKDIVKDIFKEDDAKTTTMSPEDDTNNNNNNNNDAAVGGGIASTTIAPSFTTTKATPSLNRYAIYSQKSSKQQPTATLLLDDDENVIFSTPSSDGQQQQASMSTRYVTSIEKSIRTLTLTSTKVYYTRDSPLTITSVLTTTLPPITYVSTIIGSKTILGTYNSIQPTKTATEYGSATRSTSSFILPSSSSSSTPSSTITTTASGSSSQPTTRPRLHRPKPSNVNDQVNKAKVASILNSANNRNTDRNQQQQQQNKVSKAGGSGSQPTTTPTTTMQMDPHLQFCEPACNTTNKEYCKESEPNRYTCECRPGYVRRPSDNQCQEIKNYLVTVRVSKTAESEVAATSSATQDGELQKYARVARRQVGKADGIAGLQVLSVDHSTRSKGALVNLTIQLEHHNTNQNNNVQEELSKKLEPLGRVEKIVDFDECSAPIHNDCSPRARCLNEPGSYSCQCFDPFIDLDPSMPGRLCVTEIKSCDYCHGRGDCWRNNSSDMVCRCHPMYIGRRCEINGLLLAILVPIIAILLIIAIICFFYCSRKLRQRNRRFKNLTAYGPVAVIGGTLDRKAMLETSSESSDPQHRSSHYTNESQPASVRGSMARRNHHHHHHHHQAITSTLRRESEPSLDRSLGSYTATAATAAAATGGGTIGVAAGSHYNSLPHQIVIPRARPTYTLHPGQVYMW